MGDGRLLGLAAAFTTQAGIVSAFDRHVGAGTVTEDATGEIWPFHCTRIADGSRSVEVGAAVCFEVEPGPTGLEAVAIRPRA
jgi:cold shock CspA family protein